MSILRVSTLQYLNDQGQQALAHVAANFLCPHRWAAALEEGLATGFDWSVRELIAINYEITSYAKCKFLAALERHLCVFTIGASYSYAERHTVIYI